jgi:hypothetical protein
MATQADVRRIALSLPSVEEAPTGFAFSVPHKGKLKGFVWVWMERIDPKKPRVANASVVAIRVENVGQRDLMVATDPNKFFTEPHYNGFPAVLVRLPAVTTKDLKVLLADGWRTQAPGDFVKTPTRATKTTKSKSPKTTSRKARR